MEMNENKVQIRKENEMRMYECFKLREPGNWVPSGQTTLKQLKHLTVARRPVA